MPDTGGLSEAFEPDEDMNEYLKKASLSPWVPTPDPVGRRVLDLLNANKDDVSQCIVGGEKANVVYYSMCYSDFLTFFAQFTYRITLIWDRVTVA
jgi:hypothetical protein